MKKKDNKTRRKKISTPKRVTFLVKYRLVLFPLACIIFGMMAGLLDLYFPINPSFTCANSISCIRDLTGEYKPNQTHGEFMGRKVGVPSYIAENPAQSVLGTATGSDKHIYVDLTSQRLYAFEGNKMVFNFLVSTGWWNKTPTGDYKIWIKLRYTNMVGGSVALGDYYNLPNVPYTMFLYNDAHPKWEGYGIHGTYWHHDFGHPRSHGCVNMKTEKVAQLYDWANPQTTGYTTYATDNNTGTSVTIYGTTPSHYW